jgi:hypothetical protein
MHTEFYFKIPKGRDCCRDLGIYERIILIKWILKKWGCENEDWIEVAQDGTK